MANRRILVVMAHPDDLELTCAGSIVRWVRGGDTASLVLATRGTRGGKDRDVADEMGSIREAEQQAAAQVLGLADVTFLDFRDGELVDGDGLRGALVELIRVKRPDVAVAMDPLTVIYRNSYVNHRDHRILGMALLDALYPQASSASYFPEQLEAGLKPHKVPELLLTKTEQPNYWVDVTATLDARFDALRHHRSQMRSWADEGEAIIREQREEAADLAAGHGMVYAEAFRRLIASPLN